MCQLTAPTTRCFDVVGYLPSGLANGLAWVPSVSPSGWVGAGDSCAALTTDGSPAHSQQVDKRGVARVELRTHVPSTANSVRPSALRACHGLLRAGLSVRCHLVPFNKRVLAVDSRKRTARYQSILTCSMLVTATLRRLTIFGYRSQLIVDERGTPLSYHHLGFISTESQTATRQGSRHDSVSTHLRTARPAG